jgi:hypothetical protein
MNLADSLEPIDATMAFNTLIDVSLLTSLRLAAAYTIAGIISIAAIYLIQNEVYRYTRRIRKLPGPWGWPVVGNLFQVCRDSHPALYTLYMMLNKNMP